MTDARTVGDTEPVEVLRAKYYDYCSARVADVLLELTPDEIFVLAQDEASVRPPPGALDYDRLVRLATEKISGDIDLPTFRDWVAAYRENPNDVEEQLLGLWKDTDADDSDGAGT